MTTVEQRRAWVLTRMVARQLTAAEAAELLGLSERSVWRLKRRFTTEGPARLVHGNRARASPRRIDESTREQVRALAPGTLALEVWPGDPKQSLLGHHLALHDHRVGVQPRQDREQAEDAVSPTRQESGQRFRVLGEFIEGGRSHWFVLSG